MDISFDSAHLRNLLSSEKKLRKKYADRMVEMIQRRLLELHAADTLEDMRRIVPARCHELKGDKKGKLAVDLVHPDRLVFRPDHVPVPRLAAGGMDWGQITRIVIEAVGDYH